MLRLSVSVQTVAKCSEVGAKKMGRLDLREIEVCVAEKLFDTPGEERMLALF